MDKTLTWFIKGWSTLAILVNVIAIGGMMWGASTVWAGLDQISSTYHPFNVANYVMEVVLFAPAIVALIGRDKRRARLAAK